MIEEFNTQHAEGLFNARELANECEKYIEKIRNREVRKRAKQIVKKRNLIS